MGRWQTAGIALRRPNESDAELLLSVRYRLARCSHWCCSALCDAPGRAYRGHMLAQEPGSVSRTEGGFLRQDQADRSYH